jgi:uncharacterized membrane protein
MNIRDLSWVLWNISLAVTPVLLALAIYGLVGREKKRLSLPVTVAAIVLGIAWLGFMPNTAYLLTQWRHFLITVGFSGLHVKWQVDSGAALTLMMYTLFYLCYSGIGILMFALGTRPIAAIIKRHSASLWIWGIPYFLLMSIGVYLGLVLRFNTWDLLLRPEQIWHATVELMNRTMLTSFVIAFAGFLWLTYAIVDIWIDGLLLRWRRITESGEAETR